MNPQPKTNATIIYISLADAVAELARSHNLQINVPALRNRCWAGMIPGARRLPNEHGKVIWHIPLIELPSIAPLRPRAGQQLSESELREARARGII